MLNVDWEKLGALLPVVVQSELDARVLMLGYMNPEALQVSCEEGYVCFYSRSRQCLWRKGESSGNRLKIKSMSLDCDQDTLLVQASPSGPVCHLGTVSCFDTDAQGFLAQLEAVIEERLEGVEESSYIQKMLKRGPQYVAQKVGEEAVEVAVASSLGDTDGLLEESADLLFHLLVNLQVHGKKLSDVLRILQARREKSHAAT